MSESPSVRYDVEARVARVTLDRPQVRNALGPAEWQALDAAVRRAAADQAVRAIVVTGDGGVFSAGGDLKTMPERLALPFHVRRAQLLSDTQVVATFRATPKPIVAAIEGAAVGAGLSLALACDVRICARDARLGATFHKIGLTADFGLSWLLPRLIGPTRAMDLLLSAELVDGARAEALGLVSRVVEPGRALDEALAYARRIADGPPLAIGLTKRALHAAFDHALGDALALEAEAQATCSRSADAREGVAAFFEKRAPRFSGA